MSYTSVRDAFDYCVDCYHDGEIVMAEVSTDEGRLCRACADIYEAQARSAAAQDEKKGDGA
jgi:hypothetical protein